MKQIKRVLAVGLGLIVLGGLSFAEPNTNGGGGPYKPCPTCRIVTPSAPVTP